MVKKVTKEDIKLIKLLSTDRGYKKHTVTVTITDGSGNSITTTKTIGTIIKLPVTPQ